MSISNRYKRKNPEYVDSNLKKMASILCLPDNVTHTASTIYYDARCKHIITGMRIEDMAAAALYMACRQCNTPRTLDEISAISGIAKKKLGRIYKRVSQKLGLNVLPASPVDHIPRICTSLNIQQHNKIQSTAIKIIDHASEEGLIYNGSPAGTAGAAVYIASIVCNDRKTQREVAQASGTTDVTLRKNLIELKKIFRHVPII